MLELVALSILVVYTQAVTNQVKLPNNDIELGARINLVGKVAKSIKNEKRFHTIEGISYPINDGPLPRPGSLALKLIAQEVAAINKNTNPNLKAIFAISATTKVDKLEDFELLYKKLEPIIERPLTFINFTDESFGQDRLTIKGFMLKRVSCERCGTLDLRLTSNQAKKICGYSVKDICDGKQLYSIDLSNSRKYNDPESPNKFVPGIEAFFCVNQKKKFLPLAIHIVDTNLTYSPFDSQVEWKLAKMTFNAAEINQQQMMHFTETHMSLEAIRVEMFRTMAPNHPVYRILNHHFFQIFGNTPTGLKVLLSKGTAYDVTFAWGATGSFRAAKDFFQKFTLKMVILRTLLNEMV